MLHLHKSKKGTFYATFTKKGNLVWETPKTQYTRRAGAINAMFSALDGLIAASNEREVKRAVELWYTDHTGKEPVEKLAKRRVR